MILGHEAAGVVVEVGRDVRELKDGDRVCMEPGIPDPNSSAARLGMYNLDPAVRFWATPPVHGILRPTVVHPADFTFKLPDNVCFAAGAMVEPLAVGMHAATKAQIQPGDVAVVIGAGPIGMVTASPPWPPAAPGSSSPTCNEPKLDLARKLGPVTARQRAQPEARRRRHAGDRRLGRRRRVRVLRQRRAAAAEMFRPALPRRPRGLGRHAAPSRSPSTSARRRSRRRASRTCSATPTSTRARSR